MQNIKKETSDCNLRPMHKYNALNDHYIKLFIELHTLFQCNKIFEKQKQNVERKPNNKNINYLITHRWNNHLRDQTNYFPFLFSFEKARNSEKILNC